MADRQIVRVSATGRVQGVNYRAWTEREAQTLGVDGWIRNEPDGSVSALLAGPRADVDALVARMRTGPRAARVAKVEVEAAEGAEVPAGFEILS